MAFDPTNREDKKQLYPVLRAICDVDPRETPELLIDKACGKPLRRGTDYIKNVAKGDFAKSIAQLVYLYLRDHHFDIAHKISPDIFPETPAMRWRQILDERAVKGKLKIVPMKRSMGIVQRAREVSNAECTLKLGQEFCLELETDRDGHAILLQGLRDKWPPIELIDGKHYRMPITKGTTIFPMLGNGAPDPIMEPRDLGLHEFAAIVSDQPNIPFAIERLILWVNDHDCQLHRVSVQLVE